MSHVDTTEESLTCVTLCYGIGGLDEGLERVVGPLRTLCVVEIEAVAVANVVAKMEAGAMAPCPVWTNAKTFPAHIFRDRVDWLLGGYPCTPFSLAGKRKGADDPRHLWPHFERIIEAMRPVCCLFENVDDHLTLGFPEVYCSLRKLGYAVEVGVYSAEEAGAPHERQRMFILAVRADVLADAGQDQDRNDTREKPRRNNLENELGNTSSARCCSIRTNGKQRSSKDNRCIQTSAPLWPARPGEPQHTWEHPRVITRKVESVVGLSIDGYNFREDFLRALGNMVVPATAEIAIRDLLKKHGLA